MEPASAWILYRSMVGVKNKLRGEEISSGELIIDGKVMNDVEPKDRDIAMRSFLTDRLADVGEQAKKKINEQLRMKSLRLSVRVMRL